MRFVVFEQEVLGLIVEQPLPAILDHQLRQRPRRTRQLQPRLLEVVGVKVAIAAGPDERPWLKPAFARQHVRQQRIGSDVERHPKEQVGAALVELAG